MLDVILILAMVSFFVFLSGLVFEIVDFFCKRNSCDDCDVDFLLIDADNDNKKMIRLADIREISSSQTDAITTITMDNGVIHQTKLTFEEIDKVIDYYDPRKQDEDEKKKPSK